MISVDIGDCRYQLRAAAVIVHHGAILLHHVVGEPEWTLPGGRVEPGEEGAVCVVREMREELDADAACGPLLYLVENFFRYGGCDYHETGLYYRVAFPDGSPLLDKSAVRHCVEGRYLLEYRWFELAALDAVDLRPAVLKPVLVAGKTAFGHFVQRG